MNKVKLLLSVVVSLSLLISCGDDTDGLDKRLDRLEHATGADAPIKFSFATTSSNDEVVELNGPFVLAYGFYSSHMNDYGDGQYYIYIDRYAGLERDEYISISFYYDTDTKTIEDGEVGIDFFDRINGNDHYTEFDTDGDSDQSLTIIVKSFDPETGKIEFTFSGSSTSAYEGNIFEGKAMTLTKGSFKGTVRKANIG